MSVAQNDDVAGKAGTPKSRSLDASSFFPLKRHEDKPLDDAGAESFVQMLVESVRELTKEYQSTLSSQSDADCSVVRDGSVRSVEGFMMQLLQRMGKSCALLTAVVEHYHVDPTHRDLYHHYYSRKHFDTGRFSIRVSFFDAMLDKRSFAGISIEKLQSAFLGCVVLNPFGPGMVGRTLLHPSVIVDEACQLRLSTYEVTIRGKRLCVQAFPYRQQDGEYMRCAEVSLLNLFCYYSNEYRDYQVVLPSDISRAVAMFSSQRVTPSRGLDYSSMGRIVRQFGFHPRVYNRKATSALYGGPSQDEKIKPTVPQRERVFDELLYWYVRSGIPVAVNMGTGEPHKETHSIVCIGYENLPHALEEDSLKEVRRHPVEFVDEEKGIVSSCLLIPAAALQRRYYVIDDGRLPYEVSDLGDRGSERSGGKKPYSLNYLVCLPRGMALDPLDAYSHGMRLLESKDVGVARWAKGFLEENEDVVVEMTMASVRSYKRFRVETNPLGIARLYADVPLPHYICVIELFHFDDYQKPESERCAFGELVLDATAFAPTESWTALLLVRYPNLLYYRLPNGVERFVPTDSEVCKTFPAYAASTKTCRPYGDSM